MCHDYLENQLRGKSQISTQIPAKENTLTMHTYVLSYNYDLFKNL